MSSKWKYLKTTTTLFLFPALLPSPSFGRLPTFLLRGLPPPPLSPLLNNLPTQRTTHGHYWRHYAWTPPPTHSKDSPASAKQGILIQKSIWNWIFSWEFDYFQQRVARAATHLKLSQSPFLPLSSTKFILIAESLQSSWFLKVAVCFYFVVTHIRAF